MTAAEKARAAKIAALNDKLRTDPLSAIDHRNMILIAGELKSDPMMLIKVINAAAQFADFTEDNDPHGERDCALFDVEGRRCMFKIDYYAPDMLHHSEDETDPTITRRVLTLMYASDY